LTRRLIVTAGCLLVVTAGCLLASTGRSNKPIGASTYKTSGYEEFEEISPELEIYLPTAEQLKGKVEEIQAKLDQLDQAAS
jgi:hypothetical protein